MSVSSGVELLCAIEQGLIGVLMNEFIALEING